MLEINEGERKAYQHIRKAWREGATTLNLSDLKLTKLPKAIASLTQLQQLYLHNNQLTKLPEAIASLTQLQQLHVHNNQLTELPEAIASLTQLQQLNLNNNQLTKLPEAIASLTHLRVLNLNNNQLTELPEAIASFKHLRLLYLNNNKLTQLPEAIASFKHLQAGLKIDNNPFNPDLAAAYEQGTEALLQYLRAKAEAKITLNEAKLILIGEGEVGKSCLLGALREDEWLESRPTTHGIEIKPVIVTHPDSGTEIQQIASK